MKFVRVAEHLYRCQPHGTLYCILNRGGRVRRWSLKTRDRAAAKSRLGIILEQYRRWKYQPGSLTWSQVADRWKSTVFAATDLKPASRDYRLQTLANLRKHFPKLTLASIRDISPSDCEQWKARRQATCSAQRFNNELGTLRMVYAFAIREGIAVADPSAGLKRLRLPDVTPRIPTHDEFARLIPKMIEQRNQPAAWFVELLAYSGMRQMEAAWLRWSDIGATHFHVTGGKFGTKNRLTRWVPIFPALRDLLARIPRTGRPEVSMVRSCFKSLAAACSSLGLPRYRHHDFRHFFATNAIEAGVDFRTLAEWLGHKDGGVLLGKVYAHHRQVHADEMAGRLVFTASVAKNRSPPTEATQPGP